MSSDKHLQEVLKEILEERKRIKSLPVLATRWSVIATPSNITDVDGHYVPPEPIKVSPYFGTEHEAQEWILKHPMEGHNLSLRVQYLREFTEQRWSSF